MQTQEHKKPYTKFLLFQIFSILMLQKGMFTYGLYENT